MNNGLKVQWPEGIIGREAKLTVVLQLQQAFSGGPMREPSLPVGSEAARLRLHSETLEQKDHLPRKEL